MSRFAYWFLISVISIVSSYDSAAGQPAQPATNQQRPIDKSRAINQATIGLAAGQLEGAPLRFATELARVVDDKNNMRILPVVTRGPSENVDDLFHLRGIDAAILYGDAMDAIKRDPAYASRQNRVNYLTHLFPSEVHVFARPEIKSLEDLAGKRVNFNTPGTAAAYSGPIIFDRLGIKVDATFVPHPVAMAEIAQGDKYAATVWVSSKPLDPFIRRKWPEGFKFLPVPLTDKLAEYYVPADLTATDYPGLVPTGQKVETISVPAVLAVFAWPESSDRYRRMAKFVDYLFERLPRLQNEAGYHPKWADINLAATVPGWRRFNYMQAKLDGISGAAPASNVAAPTDRKGAAINRKDRSP